MRSPFMAFIVVLMMIGSTAVVLAADEPSTSKLNEVEAQSFVQVLDITSYPDDQDGDELFDGIQVVAKVHYNRTGDYTVHFKLSPVDGSWWLSSAESQRIDKTPSNAHHVVLFEGWKIRNRGYNGYLVAQVDVLNPVNDQVLSTHKETLDRYYRAAQFESIDSGAVVTGLGTMKGLDFDGNGLYEVLEVPVIVETTTPGLYRVLMHYSWQTVAVSDVNARTRTNSMTNWSQMEAGENTVMMWVSGGHLKLASTIQFSVYVYKGVFPGTAYAHPALSVPDNTVYEAPLLRGIYADRHAEKAVDRDDDGVAESLRVSVRLDVDIPGQYTLTAVLAPSGTIDYDDNSQIISHFERLLTASKAAKSTMTWNFEAGTRWAFFEFDGRLLNAWGHDGPYDVHVLVYGPAPTIPTIFDFETADFLADQFVPPKPPLEFTRGHEDMGVMDPGAALFDALQVDFYAKVNTPATYTAFAVLYHDGQEIAYARAKGWLPAAESVKITMTFPGSAIYASGARGTFTVVIWVQGAGIAWNDTTLEHPMTTSYRTGEYSYAMFSPPKLQPDRKDPQPVEDLDFILLRTGIMVVRIDRDRPDLTFYMTDDDGRTALFRVTYTRLLAFADANEDGAPQAPEVAYTSALWAYDWDLSDVSLEEDPTTGRIATFSMSTTVDLIENDPLAAELARPLFTIEDFAKITLVFTLASRDIDHTGEVGTYSVLGGAELKVDIHIDVLAPVKGIDFLTIEQILKDDRGEYVPRTTESDEASDTPDELRRYRETPDLKQRIEFKKRVATPAFYSWVKKAEITRADGTEEVADVLAAYIVTDSRMLLYLSYPYDVETAYIYHDPSVGIYEGGFPGIPEEWIAAFDPLLYGVAALAAVAIVTSLRARGKKEEDGEHEEEEEMDEGTDGETDGEPPQAPVEVRPVQAADGIPSLPEEPVGQNGSTMLPQPPPTVAGTPPVEGQPEEWVDWKD